MLINLKTCSLIYLGGTNQISIHSDKVVGLKVNLCLANLNQVSFSFLCFAASLVLKPKV